MVKQTKLGIFFIFVIFFSVLLLSNSNQINIETEARLFYDTRFDEWREDNASIITSCDNTGCHGDPDSGNIVGSGSLTVYNGTAYAGGIYDVNIGVNGYIEGQGKPVAIGFIKVYENNSLFLDNAEDIHEVTPNLDGSGNLINQTISLKAPAQLGNYKLKVHALFTEGDSLIYYINATFDVTVEAALDQVAPVINQVLIDGESVSTTEQYGGTYTVEVNATDESPPIGVKFSIANSDYVDLISNGTTSFYEGELSTFSVPEGTVDLVINAIDSFSNEINSTFSIKINNTGVGPDADIVAFFSKDLISISDSMIDELWDDFPKLFVSEFGATGYIQSGQNGFYVFVLLAYESDINWISIEFDALPSQDNHMLDGHDGWTFGLGATSRQYMGDGYFTGGSGEPEDDFRDDIIFETFVSEADGLTYVEMIRPLNTNDPDGHDVIFNSTTVFNVQFASSSSHLGTDHTIYTWMISDLTPSGGTVTPPPEDNSNPGELSDIVFVFSFTMVLFTGFVHAVLRVVSRPIKHDKRIVQVDRLPDQPRLRDVIRKKKSESKKE
jgi:hypothetical protein